MFTISDCLAIQGALEDVSGLPESDAAEEAREWAVRQNASHQHWETARPALMDSLLSSADAGNICSYCEKGAVIRCLECLPGHLFCHACDLVHHRRHVLHDREVMLGGFLQPIPPTKVVQEASDGTCLLVLEGMCINCWLYKHVIILYIHTLATLLGVSFQQLIDANFKSASHIGGTLCVWACRHCQDDLLHFKPSIKMGKTDELNYFEHEIDVVAWWAWFKYLSI